jgi:hypothetical protein
MTRAHAPRQVVFDGGSGQGTIRWAHGKTQVGLPYTRLLKFRTSYSHERGQHVHDEHAV